MEMSKTEDQDHDKLAFIINRLLEKSFGIPVPPPAHSNTLESLVLTILSQSTTDLNSGRAFENLKKNFSNGSGGIDWEKIVKAPVEKVGDAIRTGGLANQKSERIQRVLKWVKEEFGQYNIDSVCGMEPYDVIRLLTKQKGIGVKTVSVVLAFSCGADIFPVDVHVHRVCKRIGFVGENDSAEKTFWIMQDIVPKGKAFGMHMNMIRLGRTVCRPKNPDHEKCPVKKHCDFYLAGL